MNRRVLVGFVVLNVIVSLAVAVIVISYDRARSPKVEPIPGPTQVIIYTATPLPGGGLELNQAMGTIDALALTVTAYSQVTAVAILPTQPPAQSGVDVAQTPVVATIDPALLPPIPTDLPPGLPSPTPQDDGCIRHVIESGDLISTIAQEYGVFPGDVLTANGLTEDDVYNLQIGDVLLIPVEGCAALYTPTPIPTPTNTPFELTRVAPTVTLPPTAINAQVTITNVLDWGQVNTEAVELRNLGQALNLQGWTLTDDAGDTFRFPEFRMQPGSLVRVLSRQGPNTPAALYWGRDSAAWAEGETIRLIDANGQVQATFQVGVPSGAFQEITPAVTPVPGGLSEG